MRPSAHHIGKGRVNPNGEPPLSPWFLLLILVLALIVVGFAVWGK